MKAGNDIRYRRGRNSRRNGHSRDAFCGRETSDALRLDLVVAYNRGRYRDARRNEHDGAAVRNMAC